MDRSKERQHDPDLGPSGCSIAFMYFWGVASSILWLIALLVIFTIPDTPFERAVVVLLALGLLGSGRSGRELHAQLAALTQFVLGHMKATADLATDTPQSIELREEVEQLLFEMGRSWKHGQIIGKITGVVDFLAWLVVVWQLFTLIVDAG